MDALASALGVAAGHREQEGPSGNDMKDSHVSSPLDGRPSARRHVNENTEHAATPATGLLALPWVSSRELRGTVGGLSRPPEDQINGTGLNATRVAPVGTYQRIA